MPTSSSTDRFVLDDKGAERLLEIIENSKAHPAKKIYESDKYEEGKKLLKQCFPRRDKSEGLEVSKFMGSDPINFYFRFCL